MNEVTRQRVSRLSAEFLAIVVGILGAFQLEEWRSDRDAYRIETAQLVSIRRDLVENRERLDTVLVRQAKTVASGRALLAVIAGRTGEPQADSVGELMNWAESWWRFEPVTGAYDAMVSSGDVTRLRNQVLTQDLAAFSGDLAGEFEDHVESMDLLQEMRRSVMHQGLGLVPRDLQLSLGLGGTVSSEAVSAALGSAAYAQLLAHRTVMESNRLDYYSRLHEAAEDLLEVLEAELFARGAG